MPKRFQSGEDGRVQPRRDGVWEEDVRRELIGGILETERLATPANLLCWLLVGVSAALSHEISSFALPLVMRLVAMTTTRTTFARMRRSLAAGKSIERDEHWLVLGLCVGGSAWGATMVPLLIHLQIHPISLLASGTTAVGIGIIVSLLSPIRRWVLAFGGCVLVVSVVGVALASSQYFAAGLLDIAGLFAVFFAYSFAAKSSQRQTAQLVVDNQRLSDGLGDLLDHAQRLAATDPLTGMANRRALFEHAAETAARPAQWLLLADIDNFKAINDRFGHDAGDAVLIGVANALTTIIEQTPCPRAIVARIGGEEFAALIDGMDSANIRDCAEALRSAVSLASYNRGDLPAVTVSIGVAAVAPGQPIDKALTLADRALYRAKEAGRDRVVFSELVAG